MSLPYHNNILQNYKKNDNLLFGLDLAGISEEGDINDEKKRQKFMAARKSIVESIRSTLRDKDAGGSTNKRSHN